MRYLFRMAICCSFAWTAACQTDQAEYVQLADKSKPVVETNVVSARAEKNQAEVVYDDLEWLVGKWRCVSNQLHGAASPTWLSKQAPERIEWLNVYYPFEYGQLDLTLKRFPQRAIAAEFVVKTPDGKSLPLDPGYPFHIGIDKIVVGHPAPYAVEFTYEYVFDQETGAERLALRTERVELLLEKVSDDPGDMSDAWVKVVPKDKKLLRFWKHDYQRLKFERMNRK